MHFCLADFCTFFPCISCLKFPVWFSRIFYESGKLETQGLRLIEKSHLKRYFSQDLNAALQLQNKNITTRVSNFPFFFKFEKGKNLT